MKDVEKIIGASKVFPNWATIVYGSNPDDTVTYQDIVDYITHLQSENERLNDMKFTQEYCDLYSENELLHECLREKNAEIEQLKQDINGYVADQEVYISGYKGTQAENEKLKVEIERLTEDNKRLNELLVGGTEVIDYWNNKYLEERAKNAELQKQVDELKAALADTIKRNEELVEENDEIYNKITEGVDNGK